MTDLKNRLDEAAGEEPAITDQDLAADLRRGQRSARRRQLTGMVAGVAATALVIGGGWTLLPDAKQSGTSVDPGVAATPTAQPSKGERGKATTRPTRRPTNMPPPETFRPPPRPKNPVELVRDGVRHPGMNIVCDLKPKGWIVQVYDSGKNGGAIGGGTMWWRDPSVKNPNEGGDYLKISPTGFDRGENGEKIVPKYIDGWDAFPHYQAGSYQAVINHYPVSERVPLSGNGERQIHMKVSETSLIDVWAVVPRLGWDLRTALKFAGSCHPVS